MFHRHSDWLQIAVRPGNQANDAGVPAIEQTFSSVSTLALAVDVARGVRSRTVAQEKGTAHLIFCHCQTFLPRLRSHEKRSSGFLEDLKEQRIDLQCFTNMCGFLWFVVL